MQFMEYVNMPFEPDGPDIAYVILVDRPKHPDNPPGHREYVARKRDWDEPWDPEYLPVSYCLDYRVQILARDMAFELLGELKRVYGGFGWGFELRQVCLSDEV